MPDSASPTPSRSHKWKEISDFPPDLDLLRDRELESLWAVWSKEKERLDPASIRQFSVHLGREWAIETGIIEGVYTLDRGITQTLIERGIDSAYIPHDASNRDPELVARIIRAHAEVLDGLFDFVKGLRTLSVGYIKELHAALLRDVHTVLVFDQYGSIHEYCPPEHVASEMERLVEWHRRHEERGVHPYVEAAWLHHAFTQIHPFQDGNGRVARALASLVFIKRDFFPLVVTRDDREKYIDALESADREDLSQLVRLFARIQKRALTKAISKAVDIRPVQSVEEAISVTRDLLVGIGRIPSAEHLTAKETANVLVAQTGSKFAEVTSKLAEDITRVDPGFAFHTIALSDAPMSELRAVAEQLQYDPNTVDYHKSLDLWLRSSGAKSQIVVSFHSVGPAFRGLLVAVAYFQAGDGNPIPLSDDVFRIGYQDNRVEIEQRYLAWLDSCLIRGLAEWRRSLA